MSESPESPNSGQGTVDSQVSLSKTAQNAYLDDIAMELCGMP